MAEQLSNVELGLWRHGKGIEPPRVTRVAECLSAFNFPAELATEISVQTAFRRAVEAQQVKREDGSYTKSVCWKKEGVLYAQLDLLVPEGDRMTRQRVAGWHLNGAGVQGSFDLNVDSFARQYTWADVTGVVQRALKEHGMGAYPLRQGPPYVIPTASKDMLDRLQHACMGFELEILRIEIPGDQGWKAQVADSVAAGLSAEIDAHEAALAGYNPESTKGGIVRNRMEALEATRSLLGRLALFLQEHHGELERRIVDITERCGAVLTQIEAVRPAPAGRRLVGTL